MRNDLPSDALIGAQVELSAPDGRIFRFTVLSLIPYAGETYAVLSLEDGGGDLLVTHIETDDEGVPSFIVATEEDIISTVLEKQVALAIARALAEDDGSDEPPVCTCGQTECVCGAKAWRPRPSYIRRAKN